MKKKKEAIRSKIKSYTGTSKVTQTYSVDLIKLVINDKKVHPKLSIRNLADRHEIPKSVIGRWLKNPEKTVRIAEAETTRDKVKGTNKYGIPKRKSIDYFIKKVIKKPRGMQSKLKVKRAKRDEEGNLIEDPSGEDWIVVSG